MKFSLLLFVFAAQITFAGDMFTIVQGSSANHVSFTSIAPLEEIVGKTSIVTGYVSLPDGASPAKGEVHVDLASLDTGLSLRNKHMRENHLETDKYPEAVFQLESLTIPSGSLSQGVRTAVEARGTLQMHGQSKQVAPVTWLTLSGDDLTIEADFTVSLADFNITRPEFLIMKLADEQKISAKLVGKRSS